MIIIELKDNRKRANYLCSTAGVNVIHFISSVYISEVKLKVTNTIYSSIKYHHLQKLQLPKTLYMLCVSILHN